ncbi:MAG: hypothetical protein ACRET2_07650 [Steroidobacteraceae bacterium]
MNWEAELPVLVGHVEEDGDWDDVVFRAGRIIKRTTRRRVTLGAAVLLVAAFLASPAFGLGNWYAALFGQAATGPMVVRELAGGRCRLYQGGEAVMTIPCPRPFFTPTAADPLRDFSRYDPARGAQRRVLLLFGAAAPSVAAVALLDTSGRLVAKTPVADGFYARTQGLPSGAVEAVVALDAAGKPLACLPRAASHCPSISSPRKGG